MAVVAHMSSTTSSCNVLVSSTSSTPSFSSGTETTSLSEVVSEIVPELTASSVASIFAPSRSLASLQALAAHNIQQRQNHLQLESLQQQKQHRQKIDAEWNTSRTVANGLNTKRLDAHQV